MMPSIFRYLEPYRRGFTSATFTRVNYGSRWTSLAEFSSGPAAQSRHHLRTVQTTTERTPFSGSMNAVLCDFWW